MKKLMTTLGVACAAFLLFGCGAPAGNSVMNSGNANANANAKSAAAPPTVAALFALEKGAFEAWAKKDGKFFQDLLADNFVGFEGGRRATKAQEVKMISDGQCEFKSQSLSDEKMTMVGPDAAVLVAKATVDGTCGGEKLPPVMTTATLFVRSGETWKAAFHSGTMVIDPKNPPPPPAPAKEVKPKKEAANSNSDTVAAEPVKPVAGPNTEALSKAHQGGWEAFKTKDAKWFSDHLASTFALVDPIGTYYPTKADAVKQWTETMKCEGVSKVDVSDGVATTISPTIEVLTITGNADGTCDGQKLGKMWQTAIYLKEGDAWKLGFMIEAPAM